MAVTLSLDHETRLEALIDGLHPGQTRYVFAPDPHDPSKVSRVTALLTPTRWGKTDAFLRYAGYRAQIMRGYSGLAVGITTSSMREICWPKLHHLADTYGWECRPNKLEMAFDFPRTGGRIRIFGADHPLAARLIRGQEHDDILVDEAQDFRHMDLQYLCESICMPRLADRRGRFWLSGTPGAMEGGYFYDVVWPQTNPLYQVLHGEPYENQYNAAEQRELDAMYRRANPDVDNEPWYQRERKGLWVVDNRQLLVTLRPERNYLYQDQWRPDIEDRYVLGIRWGFSAPSGYCLAVWNPTRYPYLVFLEGYREQCRLRDHLDKIAAYRARYDGLKIVIEASGPTKSVIDELKREHRVPVVEARKLNADYHEEKLNSDASLGLIKVYHRPDPKAPERNGVALAWSQLAWHVNPETGQRTPPEQRQVHDAALCVRRAVNLSLYQPPSEAVSLQDIGRMTPAERRRALQRGVLA
jgi:hypothetical protein